MPVGDSRRRSAEVVQRHVLGFVHTRRAARGARVHEIARHFGLAVDGDALAGQRLEIDAMALAAKADLHAVVDQPFGVQPARHAGALEHVDGARLEHASADTADHVFRAAPLQDQCVDALLVQQLAEQQPRGSRADDGYLGPDHSVNPRLRARSRPPAPVSPSARPTRAHCLLPSRRSRIADSGKAARAARSARPRRCGA